jgi:SP family facilitated glucose transporter-like MFS transporter 3
VASFAIGGPLGAIMGGKWQTSAVDVGRSHLHPGLVFGGLLQTAALDMFVYRVPGLASGFSSVLVPIYLGELAPPTLRGFQGTITRFAMVTGILIADLVAFPFAEEEWRLMFAVTPVVAVIQLLLSPCFWNRHAGCWPAQSRSRRDTLSNIRVSVTITK